MSRREGIGQNKWGLEEEHMVSKSKVKMKELDTLSLKPQQSLTVFLNEKVKVELRVTPLGQPEIFCDHTHVVRLFRDWYQPNETC